MYDNKAKENKQPYIEKMGLKGGTIYYGLYVELLNVHRDWNTYKQLFMNDSNIELINKSIVSFFIHTKELLAKNVIHGISKMTDYRNDSVSLNSLSKHISFKTEWQQDLKKINEIVIPLRNFRNKVGSHLDISINHYDLHETLQVSIKDLESSIEKVTRLMNAIHINYLDSQVAFDAFERHSADLIISLVRDSLRFDRIEKKFLKGDKIRSEDFWTDDI